MRKRYIAAPILGLILLFEFHWGPSSGAPAGAAPDTVAPPEPPAVAAVELHRVPSSQTALAMAHYLETAPPSVLRKLVGAGRDDSQPEDATQGGLERLATIEREIASHYSNTPSGALIRRYVALTIAGVDTDYRPDLSRERAMNDLMQDAPAAAGELQNALSALSAGPAPTASATAHARSEAERAALVALAVHVGANEQALPAVESILTAEASRRASDGDLNANEARLSGLVDAYTMLVSDPARQADFMREAIASQDDPRLQQALESRLGNLAMR